MSERLKQALEARRAEIRLGLDEAQAELGSLQEREGEVRALIRQAELALGEPLGEPPMFKLHEAIELVLREHGNGGLTVNEIAAEIERRGLYRRRDGGPAASNQIHARTSAYSHLFTKDGPRVRLRTPPASSG